MGKAFHSCDNDPTLPYQSRTFAEPSSTKRIVEQTLCGMIAAILWALAVTFLAMGITALWHPATLVDRVSENAAFLVIIALLSHWGWLFTKRLLGHW